MIDVAAARETFEGSNDFTVGIEEEFALVDPETQLLIPRFELLRDAAAGDPLLAESIAGELISSEIEIRSGVGADVDDARTRQAEARRRLFALAAEHGVVSLRGVAQLLEARHEVERQRIEQRELLLDADREVL